MKVKNLLIAAVFVFIGLGLFAQPSGAGGTNPTAYNGWPTSYTFTSWANSNAANSYPSNMVFWRTGTQDPSINSTFNADYTGAYNGSSGSRMNGEGANGVSWTNTGTTGNLGGAILAINTTGRTNVQVSYTGRTITAGARTYNLRLMYRVGTTGSFSEMPTPTAYVSSTAGNSQALSGTLPAACDNQAVVQILFYNHYSGSTTGTRPTLALDEVTVSSSASSSTSITTGSVTGTPFCLSAGNAATGSVAYTTSGTFTGTYTAKLIGSDGTTVVDANIGTGASPISITIPAGTAAGSYFVRVDNNTPATTGSTTAIVVNSLANVTAASATPGDGEVSVAWTNPTCFDNVIIVRHTATISGTPTGTYSVGNAFPGGGTVVYSGSASPQLFTGLTNGTPYFFKIFAFKGTSTRDYASGVQVTATPVQAPSLSASPTSLSGFSTPQGTASADQTYTLTGANLTPANATITVTAPTNFQVSNNGSTWGASTTATASGGSVSQTIYVRVSASAPAGAVSGNVTHSGGGVSSLPTVALSGTVTTSPPSVVINKIFNSSSSSLLDAVELLVVQNNLDMRGMIIKDYTNAGSVSGVITFSTNALWSSVPSGTLIKITNSNSGTSADVDPIDFTLDMNRAQTLYFTSSGSFDLATNDIVMIQQAGSNSSTTTGAIHTLRYGNDPDHTTVISGTPGYVLSTGSSLGGNEYVIANNPTSALIDFAGANASVSTTQTFLTENNTTNGVYICSLRGATTQPTATATGMTFTGVTSSQITINWTNPVSNGGARRIVVARLAATAAVAPTDGVDYNESTVFTTPADLTGTGNVVVYDGTGTSVTVTGLTTNTAYSFDVYEYNGALVCTNYYGTPLTGNRTTQNQTLVQFSTASSTVDEGSVTYTITLTITNPGINPTTAEVDFLSGSSTGQAADISNFSSQTVTFPGGSGASQTVNITIFDDVIAESAETFVFDLQNVSGGFSAGEGSPNQFVLTITDNEAVGNTIYSTADGNAGTDAIWSFNPAGPGQTISSLPGGFQSGRNVVIQTGHDVLFASGPNDVRDLTIQTGARAYRGSNNPLSYVFFNVYGNVIIDGILGTSSPGLDGIGLNFEGTVSTISGSGTANFARIRKAGTANTTTELTINKSISLWHDGTAIHNEAQNGTFFNVNIPAGVTVNIPAFDGSIAVDGVDGLGMGNNYGRFEINGTVNLGGYLYLSNNNGGSGTCAFNFGSTAVVNASIVISQLSSGNGTSAAFATGAKVYVTEYLDLINGTLNANNNFVIVSNAANTAYIDDFTTGYIGTLNGNVTVERYVPGGTTGFRYIGNPVNNGSSALNLTNLAGFTSTGTPGQIVPLSDCNPNNVSVTSPYGNFMYWNEAGSFPVANCKQSGWYFQVGGTMANGRGYGARVAQGTTLRYTGAANTGTVSLGTLSKTNATGNGWHLVSNPFPSAMRISNVSGDGSSTDNMPAGFQGQVQFFQPNGDYTGTYQAVNVAIAPANIALGQAFWVNTQTSGTWSLTKNHRTYSSPTYFDESPVQHHLMVGVSGNGFMDRTDVYFIPDATPGFDFYDANKWESASGQPTLYTMIGNEMTAINSHPVLTETLVIPMGLKPGNNGTFTFDFSELATFPPTVMIYLEDLKLDSIVNIRTNSSYVFSALTSDNQMRFNIRFQAGVVTQVVNQDCETAGSIEIVQPAPTVWDNYEVRGTDNNVYAQGTAFTGTLTVNNLPGQEYVVTLNHNSGYQAQEFITVDGVPAVDATLQSSATNVDINQTVNFIAAATNATEYVWDFGDGNIELGTASATHSFTAAGVYNVSLTASNDVCSRIATKTITVAEPTGLATNIAEGINVFGGGNRLTVEFNNLGSPVADIRIINMLGQQIQNFAGVSTIKGKNEFMLNGVTPGYYVVQIVSGTKVYNRKLSLGTY